MVPSEHPHTQERCKCEITTSPTTQSIVNSQQSKRSESIVNRKVKIMALTTLDIENFGPIKSVHIELGRVNVLIGPQSAGKSCILKIACHCAWVEKRIMATYDYSVFENDNYFFKKLLEFHKLQGYEHQDTIIRYSSKFLNFEYDHSTQKFSCKIKSNNSSSYRRAKLAYIPAERTLVAVVPNPMALAVGDTNTASFIVAWEKSRQLFANANLGLLGIDAQYEYDNSTKNEYIKSGDSRISFTNASSGLQSAIPLLLYVKDLTSGKYDNDVSNAIRIAENKYCAERLYNIYIKKHKGANKAKAIIDKQTLLFESEADAKDFKKKYDNFTKYQYSSIFLEEPEENIYPNTQFLLMKEIIKLLDGRNGHSLSVATHSPYVLSTINNVIQAANIARKLDAANKAELESVVGMPMSWEKGEIRAYSVNDGEAKSIIDKSTGLILAEEIDRASEVIENEFDEILRFE